MAARIVKMSEEQEAHRQKLEVEVIFGDSRRATLGVIFAFILGLAGMALGAYLISLDHPIAGTIFSGSSLAGLVGTFVYGTRSRKKEREKKAELMANPEIGSSNDEGENS